jgi:periplasmic protein TonB
MRYFLLFLTLVLFSTMVRAQSWGDSTRNQPIYAVVDNAPVFPGGLKAYHRFIADHLKLPDSSTAPYSGKPASARVIIDATGKVVFARIETSFNSSYNAAILKMISNMPAWSPGYLHGHAVATSLRIPVLFADFDMPVGVEPY